MPTLSTSPIRPTSPGSRRDSAAFLPLVVFPNGSERVDRAPALRGIIERYLPRMGCILFRGFRVPEDRDFERFVAALTEPGATEREHVWAWCAVPVAGQCVELVDRRTLEGCIPAAIRRRWVEGGLGALDALEADEVSAALETHTLSLPWHARDVLLLDAGLVTHAFTPPAPAGGGTRVIDAPTVVATLLNDPRRCVEPGARVLSAAH
jgi:hypothetical protein